MVAIFTGLGSGFERGSATQLGGAGLLGGGVQGRGGDNVSVNAANGNLVVNRKDEFLVGRGLDIGISRTYNSRGALDENGDHWRQSTDRRVFGLTGSYNANGSTVKRVSADGSEVTYTYSSGKYKTTDGAGAHDTLVYAGGAWTWTDGDTQNTEKYTAYTSNNWRISEGKDTDGNKVTFTYSGSHLSKITAADGGYLKYTWSGNNITSIETYANGGTVKTLTRTHYQYDGSDRLIKVTTDLTPENNSISDGKTYVTNYTYSGSTNLIKTITQTDGSKLEMSYDPSGRVTSVKQTAATGDIRETIITYSSTGYTRVYDPSGVQTILYHDGKEQLTRIRTITPGDTSSEQSVYFTYDASGNVTQIQDAEGKNNNMVYDAYGNVTQSKDAQNNTVYNQYDAKNNLKRSYYYATAQSQNLGASQWILEHYIYDAESHLRYTVDGEGRVTELKYDSVGNMTHTHEYLADNYARVWTTPTESQMNSWRSGLSDKTQVNIIRNLYDTKGRVVRSLNYGAATSSGSVSTAEGYTDLRYTYDSAGRVLSRRTTASVTESFLYDGLGRQISATDINGGTTTIVFNDAATKTVVTSGAGHVTTTTFNKAGDLISKLSSGSWDQTGTANYKYDRNGRLRMVTDSTGYKTYYVYDKSGNKTAEVNHYGHVTEYKYDKNGRGLAVAHYTRTKSTAARSAMLTALADPNNTLKASDLLYSTNPVTNNHSYDVWQWTAYDAKGQVYRTSEGDGSVTTYTYDKAGRLVATKSYYNKLNSTQLAALRAGGKLSDAGLPAAHSKDVTVRTFYDRSGRTIGVLNAEGYLSTITYDKAGQKVTETSYSNPAPASYRATRSFDTLVTTTPKNSSKDVVTRYIYDGQGHLRYTIDTLNKVTEYQYGTGGSAIGLVRVTIQHYATLPSLANYKFNTVKAAVSALTSSTSSTSKTALPLPPSQNLERKTWAVYNTRSQLVYAINSAGTVTQFKYDALGSITKETQFAVTRTTTGLPSESTMNSWSGSNSSNARITRNYYSAGGKLRYVVDAEGYVTRKDYDKEGRLYDEYSWANKLSVTDSWTISTVNNANKGVSVGTQYRYDSAGRLSSVYDPNGTRRLITYYANGQQAWDIRAYGSGRDESRILYVNDAAGRRYRELNYGSTYSAGKRNDVYYYYDGLGNLNRIRSNRGSHAYSTPDQNTYFSHDKNGRVLTQTNAEGGVTNYQYDAFGQVVKETNPRGHHAYNYYDKGGRLITQVDAENYVTKTTYTSFGEVYQVKRYYNRATGVGNVSSQPNVSGSVATSTFYYDKIGRTTRAKDALNKSEYFTYDAYGQRIQVKNKLGGITYNTFDKRGQLVSSRVNVSVRNSAGTQTASSITNTFKYDSRGNRTETVEASGLAEARKTTYVYDKLNRLTQRKGEAVSVYTSSTDGTASTVTPIESYTYDRRGNMIESQNSLGARTLYYYDQMDRLTHQIRPEGTLTRNFYDANSNLMETRVYGATVSLPSNALGAAPAGSGSYRRTTYTFDKLNRMTTSKLHDVQTASYGTSLSVTSTTNDLTTSYQYDALGNVIKVTDPNGKLTYSYYDKLGRTTSQVDPERYRTDWTYDTNGNVTSERRFINRAATPSTSGVPSVSSNGSLDRITDFTYDNNGNRLSEKRLNVLRHNGNGGQVSSHSTVSYLYNALGRITRKTEATGDQINYTYDNQGRMTYETRSGYTGHTNSTVTPKVQYLYNGLNDIARAYQYGAAGVGAKITKFNYDSAGRLANKIDTAGFTRTYRYDVAGQVMREEYSRATATQGTKIEAVGYKYDLESRITQQGIVMKSGSTWSKGGSNNDTVYTQYNAFGEVSQRGLNNKYSEKFDYDNAGRVWRTTSGDGTYKYLMYDNNGNQTLAITGDGTNIDNKTLSWVLDRWGSNRANIANNYVDGVIATISKYDARNQSTEVREPERQTKNSQRYDLITKRSYNAFGEVAYETDANNGRVDYTYNNMGRRIKVQSPTVSVTGVNGAKTNVRPTENYYYDHSGRLVAQRDANGNLTRQTLLKGTGYNGSQALVTVATGADGSTVTTGYDIFGNARKITDQLNRVTTQSFDNMGRVTQVNHAGGLTDSYQYDGLGQQIKHWNNVYGSGNADQMDYDQQGRIVRNRTIGGDVTTYSYSWNSSYSTSGLGTFGGWNKNTTFTNGKVLSERTDVFGHNIYRNDLSSRVTNYTYDKVGRITHVYGSGTEDQNYSYLNTGKIYQGWGQTGTESSHNWTRLTATYEYDKVGNLKKEHLVQTGQYTYEDYNDYDDYGGYGGGSETVIVDTNSTLKNAVATYDALGRLKTWNESGNSITPVASRTFEYDANANIRRSRSVFRKLNNTGGASTSNTVDDYWYRYDNMNRVVTAKGQRSGSQIVRGTNGTDIAYNQAGERVYTLSSFQDTAEIFDGYEYGDYGGSYPIYTTINFTNTRRESYTYDTAGKLTHVRASEGSYNESNGSVTPPSSTGTLRGRFYYDTLGRQTRQIDYRSNGTTAAYDSTKVYNSKSQVTTDTTITRRGNDTYKTRTTYSYGSGSSYALGGATYISTTIYNKNSSYSVDYYSSTTNTYGWWSGAVQTLTVYRPDTSQSDTNRTTYYYSAGGYLQKASIIDGRSRTITFTNDQGGQVIRRDERDNKSTGDPHEIWYRFGGKEMGYIGNNGTNNTDYAQSISYRTASQGTGAFRNGATTGVQSDDFDQAYGAINSFDQGSTAGTYTIRSGDTLQGIAANLWGDSALWYKIAQANGMSGQTQLIQGQSLILPVGVIRSTNNASTFKPYDPSETTGDLNPTTPEAPAAQKGKKCGVLGVILLVVIAVVVTVVTAGAAVAALAPASAGITGLAGGIGAVLAGTASAAVGGGITAIAVGAGAAAVGSVVSQAVGVATGIQDKFSWKSVGLAAIGGGVTAGLSGSFGSLGKVGGAIARGAVGSTVSQGIGVVTGLQEKFSWAGVAAAGVGAGFGAQFGEGISKAFGGGFVGSLVSGGAAAVASSAARSLVDGSDFGDNILSALPDVIGSTIGNALAGEISTSLRENKVAYLREIEDFKEFSLDTLEWADSTMGELDLAAAEAGVEDYQKWSDSLAERHTAKMDALREAMYARTSTPPEVIGTDYLDKLSKTSERLLMVTGGEEAANYFNEVMVEAGGAHAMSVQELTVDSVTLDEVVVTATRGKSEQSPLIQAMQGVADGLVVVGKAGEKISNALTKNRWAKFALIGLEIVSSPILYAVTNLPPVKRIIDKGMKAIMSKVTDGLVATGFFDPDEVGYAVGGLTMIAGAIAFGGKLSKGLSYGVKAITKSRTRAWSTNGYKYRVDKLNRTRNVSGDLQLKKAPRNKKLQLAAGGKDRLPDDHGGHFVGSRFNGAGAVENMFAQNGNFNLSAYKKLENSWANALDAGKTVKIDITPSYKGNSLRPQSLVVKYTINGRPKTQIFRNQYGG